MGYLYRTNCVDCGDGDAINAMRRHKHRREVSYETMRRRCPDLLEWAYSVGYGRDLPLGSDPLVGYYKSWFRGSPCYYLTWSGVEHVWMRESDCADTSKGSGVRPSPSSTSTPD